MTDNSTPDSNTYQPPMPPPARGTNGLAIASLVLSIVNLCGLGSLLAVIFGHVSLGQIKRQPQGGRGLAIAGTILGYIGVVAAAAVGITVIIAASKLNDYEPFQDSNAGHASSGNPTHPPEADVVVSKCDTDANGFYQAELSVTNHSSKLSDYSIEVAFDNPTRSVPLDTAIAEPPAVASGETMTTTAVAAKKAQHARAFTCRIVDVSRSASSGSIDSRGVRSSSDNGAHPPQADVTLSTCRAGTPGSYEAVFAVTNQSSGLSDYSITITFDDPRTGRVGSATELVPLLRAGESTTGIATAKVGAATDVKCHLEEVERSAAPGFLATVDENGVQSFLADTKHPAPADITISNCRTYALGTLAVDVAVTNHSGAPGQYNVEVAFDGTVHHRLATATSEIRRLPVGQSTTRTATTSRQISGATTFTCRLIEADRIPVK